AIICFPVDTYLGVQFIIERRVDEHTKVILRFLYIQRFYNLDNIFLFDGRFLRFVEDGNEINIGAIFRLFHQIGNNPKPTTFTCAFRSISYTYFIDVSTIAVPHPGVFKQIAFQGSKAFAKCHRDYMSSGDSSVKIFDDYIELFNPGHLPDTITIEQLLTDEYSSYSRNRKVAATFKEAQLIKTVRN